MPLRLEIKRKLSARSERVKSVDFHPREPWVLSGLYSGHLFIWNYQTQSMVKSIEVGDQPVRCAKFIARENWIVCGADDMLVRVYNYNTMELVKKFEAHTDYIRCLTVHPSLPIVLSSSDDTSIKSWNWEKNWECQQTFEGHTHYVMQVEINPKDTNTFATASLDRSVKIWGLNSSTPHFSLDGHERGVNCISYFRGGDRPYIVSGADDTHIKVWDYQTKACVSTLTGHTNNVSAVVFHPQLPIILSGAEDGTVRVWHSNTFRLENTLNYGMERVWSISCLRGANKVAIGYDDGTIMIKLGHEEPVVSMEKGGKVVWARNNDIVFGNVKSKGQEDPVDGERINVTSKDLGSCEIYPQQIIHNPNGRLLCVCGDGEYIIYTALSLKNKSFGNALEASESGVYATRESSSKIKIFKDFKEHKQLRASFAAEGIFGGQLLAARSADFVNFYDWSECRVVRRIDVCPRKIFWSETGEVVILVCDSSFFVLRYNKEIVAKYFEQGIEIGEQGIDNSFELENEIGEKVRTGYFVGDCFIYTNSAGKLNYYVGGEVMTLAHLTKTMYILGYQIKENRVYLMDKHCSIFSYELLLSVLFYQTAIVRRDFEAASEAMHQIPEDQHNRIARFLEAQDLKEMALEVSTDPEHKFELALQCNNLMLAREMALESASELKWKQLGDAALNQEFDLEMAEECFEKSDDLGGLLMLHTSRGDKAGMEKLVTLATKAGKNNIAFVCLLLLGRVQECIDLLCKTKRIPEAAFLTRTYLPSQVSRILSLWKQNLQAVSIKASEALADPSEYPELFEGLAEAVKVEEFVANQRKGKNGTFKLMRAGYYEMVKESMSRDMVEELKENGELVDEGGFVEDDDDDDIAQSTPDAWSGGGGDLDNLESDNAAQLETGSSATDETVEAVADVASKDSTQEASTELSESNEAATSIIEDPPKEDTPIETPPKEDSQKVGDKLESAVQENKTSEAVSVGDDFDLAQLDNALDSVDEGGDLPSLDDLNSDLAALENMGDGWGDDF